MNDDMELAASTDSYNKCPFLFAVFGVLGPIPMQL